MSNSKTLLGYLKGSARYPKEQYRELDAPKMTISHDEWNKAVDMLGQSVITEGKCNGLIASFGREIEGKWPLLEVVGYDDQVELDIVEGYIITLTAKEESTGWPNYGVKLPSSLVNGQTYRIKGRFKNGTLVPVSVGNYKTLYPEDETPNFWLGYNIAPSATVSIDQTFTYNSEYPYLSIGKSFLRYVGDSVSMELYIDNPDGKLLVTERAIQGLDDRVTQAEEDQETIAEGQESIYTDVYGKKRLKDASGYDAQVEITTNGDSVTFTSKEASTGWPNYGVELPTSLVNGKKYRLKGTVVNGSSIAISIGNYASLWPEDETPGFWAVYSLASGQTADVDLEFTYNSSKPWLSTGKSSLPQVGDNVTMTLHVADGENIVGRLQALEGEEGASCVIENVNPTLKATDGSLRTLLNSGTVTGWTITQETNGVRMVASGSASNYVADNVQLYPALPGVFEPGAKYGVLLDIDAKTIVQLHEQDVLEITFFFVKGDNSQNSSTMRIYAGNVIDAGHTRSLQSVAFIETGTSSSDFLFVTMKIMKVNASGATGEICNILIKRFIIFKVPTAYANYTELDFVALLKNAGQFGSLAVMVAAKDEHANLLYDGMKLKSLGDSLPETVSFQPFIAQALGMKYDATEEVTDDGNYKRSTMGATRVVPVVYSSSGAGSTGTSIYMRARSLAHWKPDVLIILAGYNDTHAGEPYIEGGTAVVPADYGLDDAPYSGGEINLLTNPGASVPSFGASYRGMVEQILTDMPWCRLVLCGIPRGSGEVSLIGTANDWVAKKNLVIEKIASEYGFTFVDLSKVYGVNALNYQWLTKDGLHFSDFGGKRVAMEILAKAF
jgi:lysophospholipase L1-like esterase